MIMTTRFHKISTLSLCACVFIMLGAGPGLLAKSAEGDEQGQSSEQLTAVSIKKDTSTFEYRIEGRPDPFEPFISERATSSENPDEIIEEDKVLTGMQLFEPSQLTLVALMLTESNKFAMVQDFTGKGYVIKEGMKIGRRGVVAEIIDNKVIIEESARTRGGQILTNKVAMALKNEGDE